MTAQVEVGVVLPKNQHKQKFGPLRQWRAISVSEKTTRMDLKLSLLQRCLSAGFAAAVAAVDQRWKDYDFEQKMRPVVLAAFLALPALA